MLTIPAAVCIAGAGTKRRLSFASIRIARGCPGPLQGDGEEGTGIARCCGTQAAGGGGDDWGCRPRDAPPFPRGTSLCQGLTPTQNMSRGGFSSSTDHPGEEQHCPAIHLPPRHPLQEMFVSRDPQVPRWLRPCVGTVSGHPSLRSVLITFKQCNQGKESIDSLSSHFCQFFQRHH